MRLLPWPLPPPLPLAIPSPRCTSHAPLHRRSPRYTPLPHTAQLRLGLVLAGRRGGGSGRARGGEPISLDLPRSPRHLTRSPRDLSGARLPLRTRHDPRFRREGSAPQRHARSLARSLRRSRQPPAPRSRRCGAAAAARARRPRRAAARATARAAPPASSRQCRARHRRASLPQQTKPSERAVTVTATVAAAQAERHVFVPCPFIVKSQMSDDRFRKGFK